MALGVGIVGLPNVGKSTLFNALTRAQNAEAANYPFCTIEPNKATVPMADARLDALAKIVNPAQIIKATVDFIDIAGLVRGASKGEGLGNKFLANIRETDALLQVVRCFADDDVVHVEGGIDPIRDIEIIETELVLADLQSLEKRIDRISRQARADKELRKEVDAMEILMKHLNEGNPVRTFARGEADPIANTLTELQFLTDKPIIYCANVGEDALSADNAQITRVKEYAQKQGCDVVVISAKMEAELAGLSDAERDDFLASYGLKESGLDQTIRMAYHTLGLASYFTAGPKEVRAWTFHRGWAAPKCAGVIHTDFERGFIRAEVIAFDDYVRLNGEAGAKAAGVMRVEGKEYIVQDGDVMHFLFNV
ncbi:MAG TPA: redox-regulated ATPase YchF [Kiritimatiellia bacterium]|nr:redox-regulated ATPase YchF [Kiritimatiellia bacterium]HPS07846.1 redox-regulated ATPase YchF [Kiritimatiellia bacterium]